MSDPYKLNHTATEGIQRNRRNISQHVFCLLPLTFLSSVYWHKRYLSNSILSSTDAAMITRKKSCKKSLTHTCTQAVVTSDLVFYNSLLNDISHKNVRTHLSQLVSPEQKVLMVRWCVRVLKNALFMR